MNMPRPPKKKTRVVAKARREGELKAEAEHEYKSVKFIADMIPFLPEKYKKNAVIWIKHLVEQHLSEIPKGIAILGLTVIIRHIIHTTDELAAKVKAIHEEKPSWYAFTPTGLHMTIAEAVVAQFGIAETSVSEKKLEGFIPDWTEWLISFALAYIIVEHGGQIALGFGELAGSIKGLVGLLLG